MRHYGKFVTHKHQALRKVESNTSTTSSSSCLGERFFLRSQFLVLPPPHPQVGCVWVSIIVFLYIASLRRHRKKWRVICLWWNETERRKKQLSESDLLHCCAKQMNPGSRLHARALRPSCVKCFLSTFMTFFCVEISSYKESRNKRKEKPDEGNRETNLDAWELLEKMRELRKLFNTLFQAFVAASCVVRFEIRKVTVDLLRPLVISIEDSSEKHE